MWLARRPAVTAEGAISLVEKCLFDTDGFLIIRSINKQNSSWTGKKKPNAIETWPFPRLYLSQKCCFDSANVAKLESYYMLSSD